MRFLIVLIFYLGLVYGEMQSSRKVPIDLKSSKFIERDKPVSNLSQSAAKDKPVSNLSQSAAKDKPVSNLSQSAARDKPVSNLSRSAARDKPVSNLSQSAAKDKPVSNLSQSAAKDKPVSNLSQSAAKDKPVSNLSQPETKDKHIFDSSKFMDQTDRKPVTKKIEQVFKDFMEILEKEDLNSEEYKKAVKFLEDSLYNSASFETLKLLAMVYKDKDDLSNYIKVLNVLSRNYPKNSEVLYLLGMVYKKLYFKEKKKYNPRNKEEKKKKIKKRDKYKNQSIDYLNQALKISPKYVLAYEALLDLFMVKNPKTDELIYNKESLSVVMDMLKALRKNKYYILLCQAYYDNNFFKQSRKACARSIQKNPTDPVSHLLLALSQPESKDRRKNILRVTEKFKQSFFVQYKTAYFFMDKDTLVAITHFERAYALQPEHMKLNEIMADFLFDNNEEEKSYKHFLNLCLLTKGKTLKYFRIVKMRLHRRKKTGLIPIFQKGIDRCFHSTREKSQTETKL